MTRAEGAAASQPGLRRDLRQGRRVLGRRRLDGAEFRRLFASWVTATIALGLAVLVIPGLHVDVAWQVPVVAAAYGVFSAVLRPLLTALALVLGWVGVLVLGVFAQAVVLYVAFQVTPGFSVDGFWPAFWASWLVALVSSAAIWASGAGDDAAFLTGLLLRSRRRRDVTVTDRPGVVVIQIDGLAAPLLRWMVTAGNLPTLSRWIRSGGHTFEEWTTRIPSTTPASQAGILHGCNDGIPAFRWFDKEAGRLFAANKPADAAIAEERISNGRGLLADDGVSIGNLFSGDAPAAYLTMSRLGPRGLLKRPSRSVASYLVSSYGLSRSLLLTAGEAIKEVYQARAQERRKIEPRIHRGGSYILLRAVSNVVLRDLNTVLIADAMLGGAPVVFCDFTDYDEIAHHAGPTRDESLRSLEGIDRVLATLEELAEHTPRPYRMVVLSDHGQSQGATFLQRYGERLEDLVRRHMRESDSVDVVTATGRDESWGPVNSLAAELEAEPGRGARLTSRTLRRSMKATAPDQRPPDERGPVQELPDLAVVGSGNLGLVYFPRHPGRLTDEDIDRLHPGLLDALTEHPGVGFLMVRTASGPVVRAPQGTHHLATGTVRGSDPLARFGPEALADLVRHDGLDFCGDIVLNSRLDEGTGEVAAFEELVGCHGGLGGWQARAVLVHPSDWARGADRLVGADAVYRQLVRWLEDLGLRGEASEDVSRAAGASPQP